MTSADLLDETLFGTRDFVAMSLERIRYLEPAEGYYLAFSGGKDSIVALDLMRRSGVRFDAHYRWTTVDPPELARFIRSRYADVEWQRPDISMWRLIVQKRVPPTRHVRYCCEVLKEGGGTGRVVVTGIRWAESSRRARRSMTEQCSRDGTKTYLHPIIDWSDAQVWAYIHSRGLPYPSLYDEGERRLGCVMCPMQSPSKMRSDARRWPKIAAAYRRACIRAYDRAMADGLARGGKWQSGDDMYEWWINGGSSAEPDEAQQVFPMDN